MEKADATARLLNGFISYFSSRQSPVASRSSSAAKQRGQTLIETVVALFILTTGLAAGLTLAVYLSGSSSTTANKVIATALAREGIEGVRRLRDSNWLDAGAPTVCGSQICYVDWLTAPYNINGAGGAGVDYRLLFNPTSFGNKWTLSLAPLGTNFRLYEHTGTGGNFGYLHTINAVPSAFFRKITISYLDTASPYDATSPLVSVRSAVWWWDKNCPQELSNPDNTNCVVKAEEYLTNWKNY